MTNDDDGAKKTAPWSSIVDYLVGAIVSLYLIGLFFFRIGEIVPLLYTRDYGPPCIYSALLAVLGTTLPLPGRSSSSQPLIGRRGKLLLLLASSLALVYALDYIVPEPLPAPGDVDVAGKTVVVTGANSGAGYETSRRLAVEYGMDVVMGCRSAARCMAAAESINDELASSSGSKKGSVTPLLLVLDDLQSVISFASELDDRSVHVLLNNAGYVPKPGTPVNKYGLDPSFTSMHLAHFLLTELLIKTNPKLRVINTSSGTHHFCATPFSMVPNFVLKNLTPETRSKFLRHRPGCIDEEYLKKGIRSETDSAAYITAKIANVMHAVHVPRRHPGATAIAVDLGWVGTKIMPFMRGNLTPESLGWMRTAEVGVLPILHAILSPVERLLEDLEIGGKRRDEENDDMGFNVNVFGRAEEAFGTYPWWRTSANGDLSRERMVGMGEKLWDLCDFQMRINGYIKASEE